MEYDRDLCALYLRSDVQSLREIGLEKFDKFRSDYKFSMTEDMQKSISKEYIEALLKTH